MPHVAVFDIETKDINPSGVVISLGVVLVDLSKVQSFKELVAQGGNIYFDQEQQGERNRTISPDTLAWWDSQGEAAKECLDNPNKISCSALYPALNRLYESIGIRPNPKTTKWFSRGYFDAVFMDSFCRTFELGPMFKFYNWRDTRSFLDGAGLGSNNEKLDTPEGFIPHNSHHDAAFEAYMMQRALNDEQPTNKAFSDLGILKRKYRPVT